MIGPQTFQRCEDCGARFRATQAEEREDREFAEFWGAAVTIPTVYCVCPDCGSDELEDFPVCLTCVEADDPEPGRALAGMDYCAACLRAEIENERAQEVRP